jgi:hypothetical protein
MKSPPPLVPLHVTEKGVARIEASKAVKHPAVKAQLAAVARQKLDDLLKGRPRPEMRGEDFGAPGFVEDQLAAVAKQRKEAK